MQKSYFFNSVTGDRKYNTDAWAEYFSTFIGNGVFPNPSTNLQIMSANDGYKIKVGQGKAFINGYAYVNTVDLELAIEPAHAQLNRIDLVVVRLANRKIEVFIVKGEPASDARAPILTRSANAYELALAQIYVNQGATAITQAVITDLRLNKNYCGIVTNVVDTVDATTLYNQYAAQFQNKITANQTDFTVWFNSVKGIMNTDLGASLVTKTDAQERQINTLINYKQEITDLKLTTASKTIVGAINENKDGINMLDGKALKINTQSEKYVKYDNGTCECCMDFVLANFPMDLTDGPVFFQGGRTTFPTAFIVPPCVSISCASVGSTWGTVNVVTATTIDFRVLCTTKRNLDVRVNIIAKGRWK